MSGAASLPGTELFFSKTDCQEFWDSCAQNKTSKISKNGRSGIVRLLCVEQNVVHLKPCTFRISGTPVRRTERRKSQKHAGNQVTKTNSAAWGRTFLVGYPLWGPRVEPKSSQIHPRGLFWTALGALLLFQTRRKHSLCDFAFSHVFITIFPPEAKFPSSFF